MNQLHGLPRVEGKVHEDVIRLGHNIYCEQQH